MNRQEFRSFCAAGFAVLDGATGTELIKRGMPAGVSPELWVYEHPETICAIHNAYIEAGSNIVYAPTFGGNRIKLAEFGLSDRLHEIVSSLVRIAKNNATDRALVFGDIAPTGRFVEPFGDLAFEEAVAVFKEAALAMIDGGADGFAIETMMDLQEARAALLGVREAAPDMPVIVTMTFDADGRTLSGATPEAALVTMQSLGADAFGCNCSTGPDEMSRFIAAMYPYARIPLVAKPNAGLPKLENGKTVFSMDSVSFGSFAGKLTASGARILGGCCGTDPAYIGALSASLSECVPAEIFPTVDRVICSCCEVRQFGKSFTVIGERINPTGKKAFQAELREGKLDLMMDFAIQQCAAGAQVLDVNMGLSGIDEAALMRKAVCRLVRGITAPLCIDSTDPEAVEAALRIYPGRALLNSISAEKERLEKVLPVAAKYGAMIIALPVFDSGIAASGTERMAAVDTIIGEAAKFGYSTADIVVDALIMSAATTQCAVKNSLAVIDSCVKRNICTVCGLSNVSYGMPDRQLLNRTFLGLALGRGLDSAIANPLFDDIMAMVKAGDALLGRDPRMAAYETYVSKEREKPVPLDELPPTEAVKECILRGEVEQICRRIDNALKSGSAPETLLNDVLIPAINEVGRRYEEKVFSLNRLINGADAMKTGASYIEKLFAVNGGDTGESKCKFIIATVRQDIHDIGKDIVSVVLKNNGFEVIDLGKDVPEEVIIDTAVRENVKFVGLSALMTTTMLNMKKTVALARERGLNDIHFIVGGAVVDKEFAESIGATYAAAPMEVVNAVNQMLQKK